MAEIVTNESDVFDQLNREPHVVISKVRLDSLYRTERMMAALEEAGVDNWEGYDNAMRIYDKWSGDES